MDGGVYIGEGNASYASATFESSGIEQNKIVVTLVSSERDRAEIIAIRSMVWLATSKGNFNSHFDSNDWCSSHVLMRVNGEPAGTLRIRWFPDAPRFERMAIRDEYRSLKAFRQLVGFALDLCAAKGYRQVIGMSRDAKGVAFWRRLGGELAGVPVEWNGESVYPMRMSLTGRRVHPALARGAEAAGDPEFELALSLPEAELIRC
ncbi:GNAT family N-acetyltransferase [Azospirillum brasilense]|uniref:N-acetyltransferase domain-containing protein n=1 Tax=Azospirillum brasilense TaxID=192 RepID=A0A235HAI4_AZOBR|nr:GNAT family N-acetyltransferase [Azospirillum brasilense]OYD82524.1 hypothetical protein CHT98_20210 [Azospirillum brasilense]